MPVPRAPDTPVGQRPLKFYIRDYGGINRNVPRHSLRDDQQFWMENLMPVSPANLRGMYSEGAAIFNAGSKTIVNVYFYNLSSNPFAIMFFSDGTATQVNTSTGVTVTVSNVANTFFTGGTLPVAAQWNATGIVITSEASANAFWAWDGTTLTTQPSNGPTWLTNGATTAMPAGLHGSAIEVYQNRVWITTPPSVALTTPSAVLHNSAPSNGADFLTADGAGATPQQDSSLRFVFNALRQSNGFLYLLGDSNISAVSNVQTGGSPVVTTYSNQNLDPQTGCTWQNTAQLYGQALIFANQQGVYLLNGGIVQKISFELDRMFAQANFSVVPSAAVAMIFGVKCYLLLMQVPDQNNSPRNVILLWNTQKWWVGSQINQNISQIYTQEFNGVMTAWGCDGKNLIPLFQVPSINLQKIIQSKFWHGGQDDDSFIIFKKAYRFYYEVQDYSGLGFTLNGTIDAEAGATTLSLAAQPGLIIFVNSTNGVITFTNGAGGAINWQVGGNSTNASDVAAYGLHLGYTFTAVGSDFALGAMALLYSEDVMMLGG